MGGKLKLIHEPWSSNDPRAYLQGAPPQHTAGLHSLGDWEDGACPTPCLPASPFPPAPCLPKLPPCLPPRSAACLPPTFRDLAASPPRALAASAPLFRRAMPLRRSALRALILVSRPALLHFL